MMLATSTTLALWSQLATVPTTQDAYTLDVTVDGPRTVAEIRPQLEEAFAPCIEHSSTSVSFRTVIDRHGQIMAQVKVAIVDADDSLSLLPDSFNELHPDAQLAVLDASDSCLADFDSSTLKLPVIKQRRPTVVEAKLVIHP